MQKESAVNVGYAFALFTALMWGVTFVSTKVLLLDFSPMEILLIRFVIAFLALCALRPQKLVLADRRHELFFALAGITGILLHYLIENVGLSFTTASNASVMGATSPFFAAIVASIIARKRAFGPYYFVGFVLAMAGIIVVSFQDEVASMVMALIGQEVSGESAGISFGNIGDALVVLAAIMGALYNNLLKKLSDLGYETFAYTKRTFAWGLLCTVVVFPIIGSFGLGGNLAFDPLAGGLERYTNPLNVANFLFLGVVISAVCSVTWGKAIAHLDAARASAFIYLIPVITVAASVLILDEPLTPQIVIGIILVLSGLVISEKQ